MTPAVLCGLLDMSGKLQSSVYEKLVKEMPGVVSGVLRPHHAAAIAGRL
jgi:hypothetical protein